MLTAMDFERAYGEGFDKTIRFLALRGLPTAEAEEISQAAWAKGWERREQLRNPRAVLSWVNTIALNIWRQQLVRKPMGRALQPIETPQEKLSTLNAKLDASRLTRNSDPTGFRMLWWQVVMGFTSHEVATMTGLTPVGVRVRTMRFKRTLRKGVGKSVRSSRRQIRKEGRTQLRPLAA